MALIIKDRVKEITTTTGTGDVSLGGASATFDAFQSVMSNGDTTFYAIVHTESGVDEWEVGLGTFNTGGTLSRTTVYSGSNGTSAVNFSSGNKDIFMTYPASNAMYKDASGNVDLEGYVDFNPINHPTHAEGRVYYDTVHKTLSYQSDITDVEHELGIEEHVRVYNSTGSTIAKGKPVYWSGNQNDVPTIALGNATEESKYNVQGLTAGDIANNSYGYVIVSGLVDGIDTSSLTAGQNVFMGLTDGALQNASPTYPNYPMCIGWVVKSHATDGIILVNQQNHSVNSFRVRTSAHIGDDLIVGGDLTVLGSQTIASSENVSIANAWNYFNSGDTIGALNTNFSGSGLNDASFTGHFTGTTTTTYYVRIDGVGTGTGGVDTFEWSTDNFATTVATGVDITGDDQLIHSTDNIAVKFEATTGHTSGDTWTGTAAPLAVDTGFATNRNTGTSGVGYTHMGIYFDVSTGKWTVFDEYDPEPEGTIDTSHSSFSYGTLKAGTFEGSLSGNATTSSSTTGNAATATALQNSRTISLTGDVSGSASFDGTANATITATVADDSHNHVISNVDGLQSALDAKLPLAGGTMTGNITFNSTQTFDGRDVSADGTKLDGIEAGATADQTASEILTAIKTVDGAASGLDADLLDGQQGSYYLNTGTTFSGDVSGTYNNIVVANDSHTHDGRYYTETEADSRFANVAGDTFTGDVTIDSSSAYNAGNGMLNVGGSGDGRLQVRHIWGKASTSAGTDDLWLQYANNNQHVQIGQSGGGNNLYVAGELYAQGYFGGQRVFHDNYHPNADKWTTARTLSLSGDASGSVSWDGSANATLSVTVADDSHNHTWDNIDGGSVNSWSSLRVSTSNGYIDFGPANTNWAHIYTDRPNFYFNKELYVNNHKVWNAGNDGSGSGLDADLLDGYHLSTTRNAANTVPVRDGNGYLQLGWINTTSGSTTSTINKIYASNDNYVRYVTPATFRSQVTDGYYLSTSGKAADSELLDGIDSGSFVRSDADDSLYGNYIFGSSGNIKIRLKGSSDPMIMLHESNTERAYMMWDSTNNALRFRNLENDYFDFYTHGNLGGIALRLMGADGDRWGSIYATDNEEIGFLDEGNSWVYKITNDSKHEWSIFNSEYMELNTTGLTLWHSGADALNFANSSTNDARGISFNGRTALSADYNDGYLRLNYGSEFTNGVYVYGNLLNAGNVSTNNVYLSDGLYHQGDTNTYFKFPGNDQITIATGGTDRIIVNSTGVRLGDTGNGYFQPVSGNYGSMQVDGGAHGGYEGYSIGGRVVFMHNNASGTGIYNDVDNEWLWFGSHNGHSRMYYNGQSRIDATSAGCTVYGDINSTSDLRYKKNIEIIDSALEKVQALRGVTFDWDNDAFKEDETTKRPEFEYRATGVIAQDVEKVLPEAVRENEDGFKNVAYGNMVGLLIEAIKEQQEQIEELKRKLGE